MSRKLIRVISVLLAAALIIPAAWLVPAVEAAAPVTVYHETFASGKGLATQSGGASLTQVTGKVFDGNTDGAALYVSNRANTWDAADFKFADIGLENGKTYTVTATVYVDANVSVPSGSQAYLQTVNSYGFLAGADLAAGGAVTLTKEFTVDTSKDTSLRVQSNETGKAIPFYIGDVLVTAVATSTDPATVTVYHENFASGKGFATQSGGASLSQVTGKVFDGNTDGTALYVTNRANTWDAADFKFADIGLVNGKTYTVSVSVFVDANATVASGSQVYLQTVNSYGFLVGADLAAGSAVILTKEFTVDTSKDTSLRVQSNEDGKAVPFYIGDILITEKANSGGAVEEQPRPPALNFSTINFEDQTAGGFVGRAGTETLTVTNEANHTTDGSYALKVEGRTDSWHGPTLRVEKYVDKGYEYTISAWVKLIDPSSSQLQLSTQIGQGSSANYVSLSPKTINTSDGWVKYEGTYRYNNVSSEYLTIYVESSSNKTASFYIDDINFVKSGSGPIAIQKDLIPIKDAYQNDFLIGNAISAEDLDGVRLELLKKHFNVVTAGNAMKPDALQPTKGNFTFDAADALVDKVRAEGMQMHGHVLVWHQQSPAWLNTSNGTPLGREEALTNLRNHIQGVMGHFGNKVISWDVVNEAMNDNPSNPADWKASLRQTPWYNAIGSDYVEQSFLAAREVLDAHPDWDIKLYYNDYNDDNQNKSQAIYNMVKEMNDRYALTHPGKLLIDGVGMQAHYSVNTNPDNVKLSLERFISLGVEISITELDIQAGSNYQLSDKLAEAQGYLYAQLFQIYKAHAAHIKRVTFWGMDDNTSWRAANNPLLFDKNLQAKPAYDGVINPDAFIQAHSTESAQANQSTAHFGTPVIDGTVDAIWSQAPEIAVNRYQMAWQGASGVAKALWDDTNLYVLVQVSDAQLDKTSVNAYEQDSVEIFLDPNNAKTSFYQDDDGQYRINFDNETSFNPASISEGFQSATKVTGTNYTVELKIPLKSITPADNKKLGFDVQINDAKDGARQSVAAWNDTTGNGYMDTSVYGVLTLAGKGSDSGSSGVGYSAPTGSVEKVDGVVTIKPVVNTNNGHAIGTISGDNLAKALEQATVTANGNKQVVIEVPTQANATSYEVQLPTKSLNGDDTFELSLKTPNATMLIPSNLLSNVTNNGEQVSIRVAKAALDNLDEATRTQIGSRPAIDLSLAAGDTVIAWNNPNAPVTVAIPYTPTAEELNNTDHIVIWYIDGDGKAISIPNGHYDVASGTVEFQTTHFSTYAVTSVFKTFGDLQNVTWAKPAIDVMTSRGVIQGISEDHYAPETSIKRADFIALLVRALELQSTGKKDVMFSDVPANAYYYHELSIAKELGIANGFDGNMFKPESTISRQDMMVLTTRALAAAGKPVVASGTLDAYSDAASTSTYAKDSAVALTKSGIVNGKDGNRMAPNDSLTRAETAVILYRIWKL
ncbi:1,4-beta-xylanase [Paenibacillus pectinilyticus]|uniref:Beta-xylanase n=1 Tax=Paenibacillus pectinilyticus TaxID=512399 RepID=A0A1C1A4F8_9BACL|nr:endo-1,4-beta-xylanase [Paenibacillus pectinilyticus]OCT15370.1 1,4-beta-xylanase [Paenibacillus pectinilyticus]